MKKRISAALLVIAGFLLGASWNKNTFSLGDALFSFFGLNAWSGRNSGTHYPGLIGFILMIAGFCLFSSTLSKKSKILFWVSLIIILNIINFIFVY